MYKSILDLESSVNKKIAANQLNAALFEIQSFVEQINLQPTTAGTIFSSPILDTLCSKIGKQALSVPNQSQTIKKDLCVYVATKLYRSGGHSAVLEDFIKYQPHKKHLILITDMLHAPNPKEVVARFSSLPVDIEWAPRGNLLKKLQWLQKRLLELQAERLFLFNHHQDSVAIAAIQPEIKSAIYFYHHADYHLCLGVHLDPAIHIDLHNRGFFHCRHQLGVKRNVYWPLIVPDLGPRPSTVSFMTDGKLTTASSGSALKFESPYLYPYPETVAKILAVTRGRHVHIGNLSKKSLKLIQDRLDQLEIPRENFMYIPWVKSVWQTLIDNKVDVYLNSFPISGGRAAIEVMGAGIPIMMHDNYHSEFLGQKYLAYTEAFHWQKPQALLSFLSTITPEWLIKQSQLSRQHYQRFHTADFLKQQLALEDDKVQGLEPLPLKDYQADKLQLMIEAINHLTFSHVIKNYVMQTIARHSLLLKWTRKIRSWT